MTSILLDEARGDKFAGISRERALRRAGCRAWARGGRQGPCPVCGSDDLHSLARRGPSHTPVWIALDEVVAG